ncbi:MAG: hypothetical protein ACXVPQ_04500 [Bacteroidia bacterium]
MKIRPVPYYVISFLVSIAGCLLFVLCAVQLYNDDDYVYNYLGCGPDGDATSIPVMGCVMVSLFWGTVHVVSHIVFILITRAKENDKSFRIKFGFYKNDRIINWFIKSFFYLFALFLIYDYAISFYKFYLFEFLSFLVMTITVLTYSLTITNLIGMKKEY